MRPSNQSHRWLSRCIGAAAALASIVSACGGAVTPATVHSGSERTNCAGRCVDTARDNDHCGSCGHACASGEACSSGVCQVECGAETLCGGACVDTAEDPAHCGACDHACASGFVCFQGTCAPPCPAGQAMCSDAKTAGLVCAELFTDKAHCGACATACPSSANCEKGICACPNGAAVCGSACIDTQSDPANCGACGSVCADSCELGRCVATLAQAPKGAPIDATLAQDKSTLYWSVSGFPGVYTVPKAGGAVGVIGSDAITALTVTTAYLYWGGGDGASKQGTLSRAPLGSTQVETLLTGLGTVVSIYVDEGSAGHVYWAQANDLSVYYGVGGGAQGYAGASRPVRQIAGTGATQYWLTELDTGPLTPPGSELFQYTRYQTTAIAAIADSTYGSFVLDATEIYFSVTGPTGSIVRGDQAGNGAYALALNQADPQGLAVANGYVYFGHAGPSIHRVPKQGGPVETFADATHQGVNAIVADSSDLYWTEGSKVMRAPL